jgi:putative flippase GtrA
MKRGLPNWERIREVVRFYQAGIVNTIFGISAYTLLVWLGMNLYVAQAVSHVMGTIFNYYTYSRHVFRGVSPAKMRFAISYAAYYVVNLGMLAALSQFIHSPYVAGIGAVFLASIVNYFALRRFVFRLQSA